MLLSTATLFPKRLKTLVRSAFCFLFTNWLMNITTHSLRSLLPLILALNSWAVPASAQEVVIPDPGLNAAIRDGLQKPIGPLTQADLQGMTLLSACCRDIRNLQGLEQARNLRILDLHSNSITNAAVVGSLPKLEIVDLLQNQLTSFVLTNVLPNLEIVDIA